MKQATLKKFGFTRRVEHRGEEVDVNIPDYVEDTGIPCPDCKLKFKNKRPLGSHIAFEHGKYAEVSSQSSSSAFKNVAATPLSQAELNHSTDAPDEIQPTSVVSIPLPETTTSDSPSTSATVDSTCEAQAPPETIEITDDQPKIKRRRIRHDVLFKAEVLQKKDDGMTAADLLVMYKSFNLDKTKVLKWSKHKENIIKAASDIHKKKLFKIHLSVKYQSLYKELYAQFTEARSKG